MTNPNAQSPNQPPPVPPMRNRVPTPSRPGRKVLLFFVGLVVGACVSALIWIAGWQHLKIDGGSFAVAIVVVPILKLGIGLFLVFVPRWRTLGAGILVSIALGALMFGGMLIGSAADYARSSTAAPPGAPATSPTTQSTPSVTCKSLH